MRALRRRVQVWDCEIYRSAGGPGTLDPATMEITPAGASLIWRGQAAFGARRSGQRRDDAYADRREEVGMLRIDGGDLDADDITVDDEVRFLEGPLCDDVWYVIGGLESAWRGTKRLMISRTKQEVAQA